MIRVPLAVAAPLASMHRPDWTLEMVPSAFTFHCWPGWPEQSPMTTAVPAEVAPFNGCRHLFPYTTRVRAEP